MDFILKFFRYFQNKAIPPDGFEDLHVGILTNEDIKSRMADSLLQDLLRERRGERRWRWARRLLFTAVSLAGFFLYLQSFSGGFSFDGLLHHPRQLAGVVRIKGPILSGAQGSAEKVIPVLERVFEKPSVRAVVLAIDSPGGQPAESEAIADRIDALKAQTHKEVWAVIGNTGASAAYMIALHADHIVAGRYSLVGSIGAKLEAWDLHKVLERFEVGHHAWASGLLKDMLDPYAPMIPEAANKAQALVDRMGATFLGDLRACRKAKLRNGVNYATGEAWTGEEALGLGLVDEIGTLHEIIRGRLALEPHDFGPSRPAGGWMASMGSDLVHDLFATLYTFMGLPR